jgi:D-ribose pyranase
MLVNGILNPAINSLLSRVRHTNTIILADAGFPTYPSIETIDISLVAGVPQVVDVLRAIRTNFRCGNAVMSAEFREVHTPEILRSYEEALQGIPLTWEPHTAFKARTPLVVGIIRTGDMTRFGNILIES